MSAYTPSYAPVSAKLTRRAVIIAIVAAVVAVTVFAIAWIASRPAHRGPVTMAAVQEAPTYANGRTSPYKTEGQAIYVVGLNGSTSKVEKGVPSSDFTVTSVTTFDENTGLSRPVELTVTGPAEANPEVVAVTAWRISDKPDQGALMGLRFVTQATPEAIVAHGFPAGTMLQVTVQNRP